MPVHPWPSMTPHAVGSLMSLRRPPRNGPSGLCRIPTKKARDEGRDEDPRQAERIAPQSLHCSFAYSALASFRMGMSGSASFQRAKKSWYALFALAVSPERA